jgi:hypothetical protein
MFGGTENAAIAANGDFTHAAIDMEGGTYAVTLSDSTGVFPVVRCSPGSDMDKWVYLRYGYTDVAYNRDACPIMDIVAEFVNTQG